MAHTPQLSRTLARSVSNHIFHDAIDAESVSSDDGDERQPLVRQDTRQLNRRRFNRAQSSLAQRIFDSSPRLRAFRAVCKVFIMGFLAMYCFGWYVWITCYWQPCDRPLVEWLLLTQIAPLLQCCVDVQVSVDGPVRQTDRIFMRVLQLCVLCLGVHWLWTSKTCMSTNSLLYKFSVCYAIFQSITYLCILIYPCVAIGLILYGLEHDWFPTLDGASDDTIEKIQSVKFSASASSSEAVDEAKDMPDECCCCWEAWIDGSSVKKTPCGHFFHEECLGKWLKRSTKCPLCRTDLEEAVNGGIQP
eukprot:TRINITY_DN2118_c0_g2_i1.p1 TRINITY_DN2118_c0_g2~~TRINITY_DN2118_c0_g2_i1.p1  ORF type:complete len:303 (+),score=15.68 TRINITY_DN2118_c0_g2_i1:145-1053(+)